MKAVLLAAGSALCALGALVSLLAVVILLFIRWHTALLLVPVVVCLAMAARFLDRAKMRTLYGRISGDQLWEADDGTQSCMEAARRLLTAYHEGPGGQMRAGQISPGAPDAAGMPLAGKAPFADGAVSIATTAARRHS